MVSTMRTLCVMLLVCIAGAFHSSLPATRMVSKLARHHESPERLRRQHTPKMMLHDVTTHLIAVGDYASEVEKATSAGGEDLTQRIFQAGLFLFLSGIVSAFITAALVSRAGTMDALRDEFDEGKKRQFIEQPGVAAQMNYQATKESSDVIVGNERKTGEEDVVEAVKDLDI